jgi:hypothetical protein
MSAGPPESACRAELPAEGGILHEQVAEGEKEPVHNGARDYRLTAHEPSVGNRWLMGRVPLRWPFAPWLLSN